MVDKYVSILTDKTGALKVQTEACTEVNVKCNIVHLQQI